MRGTVYQKGGKRVLVKDGGSGRRQAELKRGGFKKVGRGGGG